jgi:hypothetical protein
MSKPMRVRNSGRVAPRKATKVPKAKVPAHAVVIRYGRAVPRAGMMAAYLLNHRSRTPFAMKVNLGTTLRVAFVYYSFGFGT